MWTCSNCGRIYKKVNQPHCCQRIPLEKHFRNKGKAWELFNALLEQINSKIGAYQVISIPCCVHLFGHYDFLAALPKKDRLEIRFAYHREIDDKRIKVCVPTSARYCKICLDMREAAEIDEAMIKWLREAYHLKD